MTNNITTLVRKNILELKPYSSARHEFEGDAEVYLDANENPFENGLNRYPDPFQQEVKQLLSNIKRVPVEHIFLGNGSDEAIDLLIRIFCEPRIDHIITLPPTYGMYKVSASIADVAVKSVLLRPNFQPDVGAILKIANEHSKLLFVCSPNNPTGNNVEVALIEELLTKFKGIVVIDEAYSDFAARPSFNQRLLEYPNLVVLQTFSKAWGMAGIRLGIAYANPSIIQLFNKVKPPYNVNVLTQQSAVQQLQKYEQQQANVQLLLSERAKLETQLAKFDFIQQVHPSDTNFILMKVNEPLELYRYLIEHKIIVRNRSTVPLCEGCLRITVGTPEENLALLTTLHQYTKK